MTHHDCIATLLAGPKGETPQPPGQRDEARAHAARCSDCWAVLVLLHELAVGAPPEDAGHMAAAYGCASVQDDLYLLAILSASEMRAVHPEHARHLGWCLACRERLAEVLVVERAVAREEFGPAVIAPAEARWREVAARAGVRVHEVVGRVVVRVRRAAAAITTVPEGFTVVPFATAGALRGNSPAAASPGQLLQFALPDSTLSAELTLEPRHDERVGVALRFSGGIPARLSVLLHELRDAQEALVARHSVRGEDAVVFRGLGAGQYLLEIREREPARSFKVRFDVETPA